MNQSTNSITIDLENPIRDGSKKLTSLVINKPNVRQLQNINMHKLLQFETNEWMTFLPCICQELETCIEKIDIADFLYIMQEVAVFFVKKSQAQSIKSMQA